MTDAQNELLKLQVQNENVIFAELKKIYSSALKTINDKIKILQGSNLQSKIYQLQYQKALKKQVSAILDNLTSNEYSTISEYLEKSYEFGYLGTMYDLQKQGVPLIFPINQEDVVNSILNNSKLSKSLYDSLGVNVNDLKKQINIDISRGLASDMSYGEIARSLNSKMGTGLYNAQRIVRTESGRIKSEASYNCMTKAKDSGADVVKEWCSVLDRKTRPTHRILDGQIKELDEPFVVNGHSALYSRGFGVASEDVNCRCEIVQRARWAVEDGNLGTKWDNENRTLIDLSGYKSYEEFKKAYYDKIDYFDEYKDYVKILGEKAPSNFDDFLSIRKSDDFNLYKQYVKALEKKELTALADFELYKHTSNEIDSKLIGLIAKNGIEIKGKSYHFISRMIGSISEKRNGVSLEDVEKSLLNPTRELNKIDSKGRISYKFFGEKSNVSFNQVGLLIQCNPLR